MTDDFQRKPEQSPANQPRPKTFGATASVIRVLGIDIRVHISVVVIFALITTSLAANLFPQWHPEWSTTTHWLAAIGAGLLFFVSLVIHELSHSVVAQRCGIEISAITLFLFGGVAEMKGEPETPRDEFLIAGAGPLASLILAFVFGILASLSIESAALLGDQSDLDMAQFSVTTTIFMWLSSINMMLAVFNMLPGFPMDGGRLFRAALWWRTGNLMHATEMAARVGSGFGWVFIGFGALQIFSGNTINGLWMVLIGWFIRRLALTSVASLMLDLSLRGFDVRAIMRTRFESVPADTAIRTFIDDYLLRSTQQLWPVVQDNVDIGYISAANLQLIGTPLAEVTGNVDEHMHALFADPSEGVLINPNMSAKEALERLADAPTPLPVIEQDKVVGIIHQSDILRWFSFHKIAS